MQGSFLHLIHKIDKILYIVFVFIEKRRIYYYNGKEVTFFCPFHMAESEI